jgi:DNA-binding response OmpR family regulator
MRVLLATDRPDLGHALSLFLSERSVHVVDVVDDFDRLMDRAATARPDVVLVDWSLGEALSSQVVADLMGRDEPTPVIVLSTSRDRQRARACGAAAYATLGDPPDTLLDMLFEVCSR